MRWFQRNGQQHQVPAQTPAVVEPQLVMTVLDTVCSQLAPQQHWSRQEIADALTRAMIPLEAPYSEWWEAAARALTLLQGVQGTDDHATS